MNNQAQELASGQAPTLTNKTGIDMGALIDEWKLSKSYVERYTVDFPQLDNLVDGIPIMRDQDAPFVGDTTLGGLVRSMPRESLQQIPVFSAVVNGTKNSIPALACTYLLKRYAFNEDTFGKGLLSTLQIGAEQALTRGYAPFMVATGTMFNDFGTVMRLLHYSDAAPEPGITDHNETGYDFVVANLTPTRVKKMLRAAKNNPDGEWSAEALQLVLDQQPRAKEYSIYAGDADKNAAGEAAGPAYQFVTRYETGQGGTIITFCPEVSEMPLRVIESHSKWGYPRVMYLVIDPAALTPFGKSRVRLASPNQNLMNIYYGNIAAMLLLNSKPPILKRGRFTTPVQLKQGVVWETLDQNATAELKNLDNGSLQFFPQMAQQFATQVHNIMGGKTINVNAGSGAAFGKTTVGQKRAEKYEEPATNQITKILENFLRQYALVALDTLLSEQIGEDELIVDDETKNSINAIAPGTIGDNNKMTIVWEDFYAAIEEWTIEVTVSLSKDEMDEKKRGDLQDMLVVLAQNAKDNPEAAQKVTEITNMLLQDKAPLVKTMSDTPVPQVAAGPMAPTPDMAAPQPGM
jgi:hypothetical protein